MAQRHHWQVWREVEVIVPSNGLDGSNHLSYADDILFEGSRQKCETYYKRNGGSKAGLHIGYVIPEDKES